MSLIAGLQTKGGIVRAIRFNGYRIVRAYVGDRLIFDHYIYDLQIKSSLLMDYLTKFSSINKCFKLNNNMNLHHQQYFSALSMHDNKLNTHQLVKVYHQAQLILSTEENKFNAAQSINFHHQVKLMGKLNDINNLVLNNNLFLLSNMKLCTNLTSNSIENKVNQTIPIIEKIKLSTKVDHLNYKKDFNFFVHFNFITMRLYYWEVNKNITIDTAITITHPDDSLSFQKILKFNDIYYLTKPDNFLSFQKILKFNDIYYLTKINNFFIYHKNFKMKSYNSITSGSAISMLFNNKMALNNQIQITKNDKNLTQINNIFFSDINTKIDYPDDYLIHKHKFNIKNYQKCKILPYDNSYLINTNFQFNNCIILKNNNLNTGQTYMKFQITHQIPLQVGAGIKINMFEKFNIKNNNILTTDIFINIGKKNNLKLTNSVSLSKYVNENMGFKSKYNIIFNNHLNYSHNKQLKYYKVNIPLQCNYFVTFEAIPKTSKFKENINLSSFVVFNKEVIILDTIANTVDFQNINHLNVAVATSLYDSKEIPLKYTMKLDFINDFLCSNIYFNLRSNVKMQNQELLNFSTQINQQLDRYNKLSKNNDINITSYNSNIKLQNFETLTFHDIDIYLRKQLNVPKSYSKLKIAQGQKLSQHCNISTINSQPKLQVYFRAECVRFVIYEPRSVQRYASSGE